MIKKKFS